MIRTKGKVIIAPDVNVWPHELDTARALADAGRDVEFIKKSDEYRQTSADVMMQGVAWEMKAPKSEKLRKVEENLRHALHQSRNVIFDSRRMRKIPDHAIERELRKYAAEMRSLERLVFVNKRRAVIDIK